MNKLFIILIAMFLIGCVTTPESAPSICMCPKENVIIHGEVNGGFIFLRLPGGSLCDPDTYWTEDEFDKDMEKAMREMGEPL